MPDVQFKRQLQFLAGLRRRAPCRAAAGSQPFEEEIRSWLVGVMHLIDRLVFEPLGERS